LQEQFINQLLASLSEEGRRRLAGFGHS
jgi:hypothetical protein